MHANTVLVRCALEDQSFEHTILLLCISKPHLVQASMSTRLSNHTCAWIHTYKNGGYRYFKHLCPVVISNSNPVSEYWHEYPALKLSSMSHSSALILVHIIKNNFNSTYCPCLIVTGRPQIDSYCSCIEDVRSKYCFTCYYVCLSQMFSIKLQFRNLLYKAVSVAATGKACIIPPPTRNFAAV